MTSHMNSVCFYRSFFRKVRSHLGEPATNWVSSHPHKKSFNSVNVKERNTDDSKNTS